MDFEGFYTDKLLGRERLLRSSSIISVAEKYNIPTTPQYPGHVITPEEVTRMIYEYEKNNRETIGPVGLYFQPVIIPSVNDRGLLKKEESQMETIVKPDDSKTSWHIF